MAKNSEWGAVAYLSHSRYGKDGEVYINNCNQYITGIGADSANAPASGATCITDNNKYNGESGKNASTAGNEYGVYDMSGGANEYVMGVYRQTKGSSGFNDNLFGIDEKYYDNYITNDILTACGNKTCYGHALIETKNWYNDTGTFVNSNCSWFHRGGLNNDVSNAGVFGFSCWDGGSGSNSSASFRVVLASSITG